MNASAIEYMRNSLAPKTEQAYDRAFKEWEKYAMEECIPILPITPIDLGNWAQRLINLEIPVLVRSLKSSNVELG